MEDKHDNIQPVPHYVKIQSGRPIEMTEIDDAPFDITEAQHLIGRVVRPTIKSYVKTAQDLLENKYSNIRDYAPLHLLCPSKVLILCCTDGIIIRYESSPDKEESVVGIGYLNASLCEAAPKISEAVVHCHTNRDWESTYPVSGPILNMTKRDSKTGTQTLIFSARTSFHIILQQPTEQFPPPPAKPYCLLSARNSMELSLIGKILPDGESHIEKTRFVAHMPMKLPVGWECIEVFPFIDPVYWKPEFARTWAENDILAAVTAQQLKEINLNTLDPNALARRQYFDFLQEYKRLLDSDPEREEVLQIFLKENPFLLCPTYTRMWPKLAIGACKTDFVFRDATGDYLLVELEKSTHRLFLQGGDRTAELRHAQDQVSDWKRYIEDNPATVRTELGLTGISSNPRSLIVIGRSSTLTQEGRRKLQTFENDSPKNKIMTYDDLFESTKAIIENLFGPFWGEVGNTQIYYLPHE